MDHFIAVDNVCAWPNLTLLRDGSIVATIFNQPCHGMWEGDVECWASVDGGRSWKLRGTPAPHEPGTNRMNVAAGLAANGDLIVIASGWDDRPPAGTTRSHAAANVLTAWVSRSSDGGRSWTITRDFPQPSDEGVDNSVPFGDIAIAADGSLCVTTYSTGHKLPRPYNSVYFHRSRDDGRTWDSGVILARGDHNETAPLHLGGGRWLAAVRTHAIGQGSLDLFTSSDDGRTWALSQPLAMPRQHPAHLLRLADGQVLLTYGNRCAGQYGIDSRISSDDGKTWSAPVQLVRLESADLGYPATVQLADGKLVTAYYASRVAYHMRYHMGVAIWEPAECFPTK